MDPRQFFLDILGLITHDDVMMGSGMFCRFDWQALWKNHNTENL